MANAGEAYRLLSAQVLGYFRAQRVSDPEDLVGEVFLQVARDIGRFRGDDADLRRWVFSIAHNRLIDARRREQRRPQTAGQELPDLPAADRAAPLDPALVEALDTLTPDQREIVVLRFVADLSLEQVARITGTSVGAVKALQHRGLQRLARAVGGATDPVDAPEAGRRGNS